MRQHSKNPHYLTGFGGLQGHTHPSIGVVGRRDGRRTDGRTDGGRTDGGRTDGVLEVVGAHTPNHGDRGGVRSCLGVNHINFDINVNGFIYLFDRSITKPEKYIKIPPPENTEPFKGPKNTPPKHGVL